MIEKKLRLKLRRIRERIRKYRSAKILLLKLSKKSPSKSKLNLVAVRRWTCA